MPPEVIDNWPIRMPTNVIDRKDDDEVGFAAFQSQKATGLPPSSGITWESMGTTRNQEESPPNPPTQSHGGCGEDQHATKKGEHAAARPETESARLLRSITAFPSSIEELADMPVDLVGGAIAYAQSEPGIASVAGWVVEALRRHRDEGWPIPAPRRPCGAANLDRPIDIEKYTSGAYGDLFRRGSDTSGLDDVSVDREEGALVAPRAAALAQAPEESPVRGEVFTDTDRAFAEVETPADCLPPESADDELTRQVLAELRLRCGRQRGRVIEGVRIHVAGDTTVIICATFADMDIVQRELIGALQHILGPLSVPPQLVFTTRAGWEARKRDAGNARSRPDVRQGVPFLT